MIVEWIQLWMWNVRIVDGILKKICHLPRNFLGQNQSKYTGVLRQQYYLAQHLPGLKTEFMPVVERLFHFNMLKEEKEKEYEEYMKAQNQRKK